MSTVTVFNDPWVERRMAQTMSQMPGGASDDSLATARAIMEAGALIAQAIELATMRDGRPILNSIADSLDSLAIEHGAP